MPYIISTIIKHELPGLWAEGSPYKTETIYNINNTISGNPPVNYLAHTLKPHSLCHYDAPAHVYSNGKTIDKYFSENKLGHFFGKCILLKLKGNNWKKLENVDLYHWEVSLEELKENFKRFSKIKIKKLFLTTENIFLDKNGLHDSNYALTLSEDAANWLISENEGFDLYATSWKSTDFRPGSRERPVHKIIFKKALILECLKLDHVPEGEYFFSGIPLPLENASESPVCPVLFTESELK